ncbi:MAG: isochorismatase family cysteine hydrolase [Gammaproteobacteria bacterium]|nr:isochorismatase family cysteine hydrolase [Gammaproteobacteria bacterium]
MHQINIPNHIIERCIARRGRRYLFEELEPQCTALLVIDMQNCFVVPGLSYAEVPGVADIAPNINALVSAMRKAGGSVIWTQHIYTSGWSSWHDYFTDAQTRAALVADTAEGAFGRAIWDGMDVADDEPILPKTRSSALVPGTSELKALLDDRQIDTLIITGTLTNVCCESTARDAMFLNYKTLFVADATGTRSDDEHNATLVNMIQFFADVRMTKDVISLLRPSAGTSTTSEIK